MISPLSPLPRFERCTACSGTLRFLSDWYRNGVNTAEQSVCSGCGGLHVRAADREEAKQFIPLDAPMGAAQPGDPIRYFALRYGTSEPRYVHGWLTADGRSVVQFG